MPSPQTAFWPRFVPLLALVALMWLVRAADFVLPGDWNTYGVRSWDVTSAFGIVASPLLHSGWPHLLANTVPFLVLGALVSLEGARRFLLVTAIVAVVGGIGTWLFSFPGTVTVGASGLVFGYFGYLLARGLFMRNAPHRWLSLVIGAIVALVYGGSMLQGLLPVFPGISWQGHLFGGVGGVLAAFVASRGGSEPARITAPQGRRP